MTKVAGQKSPALEKDKPVLEKDKPVLEKDKHGMATAESLEKMRIVSSSTLPRSSSPPPPPPRRNSSELTKAQSPLYDTGPLPIAGGDDPYNLGPLPPLPERVAVEEGAYETPFALNPDYQSLEDRTIGNHATYAAVGEQPNEEQSNYMPYNSKMFSRETVNEENPYEFDDVNAEAGAEGNAEAEVNEDVYADFGILEEGDAPPVQKKLNKPEPSKSVTKKDAIFVTEADAERVKEAWDKGILDAPLNKPAQPEGEQPKAGGFLGFLIKILEGAANKLKKWAGVDTEGGSQSLANNSAFDRGQEESPQPQQQPQQSKARGDNGDKVADPKDLARESQREKQRFGKVSDDRQGLPQAQLGGGGNEDSKEPAQKENVFSLESLIVLRDITAEMIVNFYESKDGSLSDKDVEIGNNFLNNFDKLQNEIDKLQNPERSQETQPEQGEGNQEEQQQEQGKGNQEEQQPEQTSNEAQQPGADKPSVDKGGQGPNGMDDTLSNVNGEMGKKGGDETVAKETKSDEQPKTWVERVGSRRGSMVEKANGGKEPNGSRNI